MEDGAHRLCARLTLCSHLILIKLRGKFELMRKWRMGMRMRMRERRWGGGGGKEGEVGLILVFKPPSFH